ncbi:muts domain V-domain-containing protein [Sporodiniella umbellata]|nr:muts domain V-domain-containing protein [Sporodiniella umbellata]
MSSGAKQSSILSFFAKKEQTKSAKTKLVETDSVETGSAETKSPTKKQNKPTSKAPSAQKRNRKQVVYQESEEEAKTDSESNESEKETIAKPNGRKRRLVRRISDDSEEEYIPPSKNEKEVDEEMFDDISDCEMMEIEQDSRSAVTAMTPIADKLQKFSLNSDNASSKAKPSKPTVVKPHTSTLSKQQENSQKFKEKNEERYYWLQNIMDAQKNPITSDEYDPRTLFIPQSAWNKFTPFEKQYWEVKCQHWSTVVFFKKGKFYELYEKDADIGHRDFDLKMTDRVNMRMVGVPEMSFDYWAAQFIAKGYKVAKVDQMETAIGKSMREKGGVGKQDKIIRRELTSVLTAGTLVDAGLLTNDLSTFCMSIKEQCMDEQSLPRFGICFVDTATAEFNLVHFDDDIRRTKLETLLMQIKPKELVTEKGRLTKATLKLIKMTLNEPIWNMVLPETEFWDEQTTEDELKMNNYFGSSMTDEEQNTGFDTAIQTLHSDPILMSALGGMIWYLRSLKLDRDLLSAKHVSMYDPIRQGTSLVLDGQTLANLEIFQNSHDQGLQGTVFKLLANNITPFGKRLFKRWLCHPLRQIQDINTRLDATEDLMRLVELNETIAKKMTKLPDLERLMSRIHTGSIKVKEFLMALEGFALAREIMEVLKANQPNLKSSLLASLCTKFPDIEIILTDLSNMFITADVVVDYQKVKSIIPKSGKNEGWDRIIDGIHDIESEFESHLSTLRKQLKCSKLEYKDLGKDIYQIEVPKGVSVPKDWIQLSNTAKVNRYWDKTVKQLVVTYKEQLETKNEFVKNFSKEVYACFDKFYTTWLCVVNTIAELDALMGLAKGSVNMGEPSCRPVLLEEEKSVIEFEELRHPCVDPGVSNDFIPNDTILGGKDPNVIVLTGPNMGGKSTILRQTCVAIILAQIGGYVPAKSCRLTPCDRIFTRIGANDNIMGGQSTFMVEMSETSKILKEATSRSMVILDELGRGTSTFDGYAIAYSVLHHLCTHTGCLGMFATHYQALCKEFDNNPEINNMHM